jgi:hypothetical protein
MVKRCVISILMMSIAGGTVGLVVPNGGSKEWWLGMAALLLAFMAGKVQP